ncbi:hypothetical protein BASA81_012415 [Batrachochytrium salamandrivorans]|nr:hypothetical protein BASA81_012415 [Batrachochytrium salamandrivorans]
MSYDLAVIQAIEEHTLGLFRKLLGDLTEAEGLDQVSCVSRFPVYSCEFLKTIITEVYDKALDFPRLQPCLVEMCHLLATRKRDWEFIQAEQSREDGKWSCRLFCGGDKKFESEAECVDYVCCESNFTHLLGRHLVSQSWQVRSEAETLTELNMETREIKLETYKQGFGRRMASGRFIGQLCRRMDLGVLLPQGIAHNHLCFEPRALDAMFNAWATPNWGQVLWEMGLSINATLGEVIDRMRRVGELLPFDVMDALDQVQSSEKLVELYFEELRPSYEGKLQGYMVDVAEILRLAVRLIEAIPPCDQFLFQSLLGLYVPYSEEHTKYCEVSGCFTCFPFRSLSYPEATSEFHRHKNLLMETLNSYPSSPLIFATSYKAMLKVEQDVFPKWYAHASESRLALRRRAREVLLAKYQQTYEEGLAQLPFEILLEVCLGPPELPQIQGVMMLRAALELRHTKHTLYEFKQSLVLIREAMTTTTDNNMPDDNNIGEEEEKPKEGSIFYTCDSQIKSPRADLDENDKLACLFKYLLHHHLQWKSSGCTFRIPTSSGMRHVIEVHGTRPPPELPPAAFAISQHPSLALALAAPLNEVKCAACGKQPPSLEFCSKCEAVAYCDRQCQSADWKLRHKRICHRLA